MAKTSTSSDVYQIKITLHGSKPPIWRRFTVPGHITLEKLHHLIQAIMGWYDGHLHVFIINGESYTAISRDGIRLDVDGYDERKVHLSKVAPNAKAKFKYEYDFGDGWDHKLLVEKIIPASDNPPEFVCLAGAGRCPPEDCGGIWGYYHLLDVLNNPDDPEHEDMMEWTGGKIDPKEFDVEEINRALAFYASNEDKTGRFRPNA